MKVVLALSSLPQSELESCFVLAACVPDQFCPEEIVRGYYTIYMDLSIIVLLQCGPDFEISILDLCPIFETHLFCQTL